MTFVDAALCVVGALVWLGLLIVTTIVGFGVGLHVADLVVEKLRGWR